MARTKWRFGLSPLMHACLDGDVAKVRALLAAGADPNAATHDKRSAHDSGRTALHIAAGDMGTASLELVQQLLDAGATIDAVAGSGHTPLCHAAAANARSVVELLLRRGARVDRRPVRGDAPAGALLFTPLYEAAQAGHDAICALLLAHGAPVNVPIWTGATPLMGAADAGAARVVARLLAAGANPRLRDERGATALDHARSSNRRSRTAIRHLLAAESALASSRARPASSKRSGR